MTQLDERTRRALLAVDDPPRGVEDRIHRAILMTGPPGGGGGGGGEPAGGGGLGSGSTGALDVAFAAKVAGATLGLTSAGVLVLALVGVGVRAIDRTEPARERVVVDDRKPTAPALAHGSEPAPVDLEPTSAEVVDDLELEAATRDREPSATSKAAPELERAGSTLEAELALIQRARDADAPADVLAELERHRDQFAQGVLADEREVMRVEALCALGRQAEAGQVAAAFVAARPNNPLRSRVEPACAD